MRKCTIFILFLLLAFGLTTVPDAQAQVQDNQGKEFIVGFMPNFTSSSTIELHLTAAVATTVTVEYPVNSPTFTTSVGVTPGAITIVSIPSTSATSWGFGVAQNNLVRAFADEEFVLYGINRTGFTSDAYLGLPVDVLNNDYVAMTWSDEFRTINVQNGQVLIGAPFDNTEVTIIPTNDLKGGFAAGTPFTITLNRGEGFFAETTSGDGLSSSLAGTSIKSTRPVTVINGNRCTDVLNSACDHITEQAQPIQSWGNQVFVQNLPNRLNGVPYRVIASEDNTTITQNGVVVATIDADEFYETAELPGSHVFEGDKPIFVAQFMSGVSNPGATLGDPAMGNMAPSEQYLQGYTFSTVGGNQFVQNFVTIIAEDADVTGGTILLDGVAVPAGDFSPIGTTGFQAAVIPIADGTHTTSSNGFHGITVEGYNSADSYVFPGGAKFQFINPVTDMVAPVCNLTIAGTTATGEVRDDQPDDTGVFLVDLLAGSTNLQLTVDPFIPGDPVATYTVSLIDPSQSGSGTIQGTDGSGNTCTSPITIDVNQPTDITSPVCELAALNMGPPLNIDVFIHDPESGVSTIEILSQQNATVEIPKGSGNFFNQGDIVTYTPTVTTSFLMHGVKVDPNEAAFIAIKVTDDQGNSITCDPVVTTVSAEIPEAFQLEQNFPNPFNPTTIIPFQIDAATHVTLKVFDITGREVATLVDQQMEAGQYQATWDSRNSQGYDHGQTACICIAWKPELLYKRNK